MPLADLPTATDALNKLLYIMDATTGIDIHGLPVAAQLLPENFATMMSDFVAYKTSRQAQTGVTVPFYAGTANVTPTFPPNENTTTLGGFPLAF